MAHSRTCSNAFQPVRPPPPLPLPQHDVWELDLAAQLTAHVGVAVSFPSPTTPSLSPFPSQSAFSDAQDKELVNQLTVSATQLASRIEPAAASLGETLNGCSSLMPFV